MPGRKAPSLHQRRGSTIDTDRSTKLTRNISGLGMEDPVFGTKGKVLQGPAHPSAQIFDDMSFGDCPEDMKDMVSIASDPTAEPDTGLDAELFHSNLTGMQVCLSEFSVSELLSTASSTERRRHRKGHTKNTYVSTKADFLGLHKKKKSAASSDETTTSGTLPSTKSGASVASSTWQDITPNNNATKAATYSTQLSACQSGDESEIETVLKELPSTNQSDAPATTPLQQSNSSINAEAWVEEVKLVSQQNLDFTCNGRRQASCFRRNSMGPSVSSSSIDSRKPRGTIRQTRRRSFCAMLGMQTQKEETKAQTLEEYQAELLEAMAAKAEMDLQKTMNGVRSNADTDEHDDKVQEDDESAVTVADPRLRIHRTPYIVSVAPPVGMKPRLLPTVADLFPETFALEESASTMSKPTKTFRTVDRLGPTTSIHSFFGDTDDDEDSYDSMDHDKAATNNNRYFESTHAVKSSHFSVAAH